MKIVVTLQRPLWGAYLSQESIDVVCSAILQLFWRFMRFFVVGPRVFQEISMRMTFGGILCL